jgi:hypothetical protein
MPRELESKLVSLIQTELGVSLGYGRVGATNSEMKRYKTDPVFSLFMMDSKDVVEARARGALVMSITRKLGDLYEHCVKEILKNQLGLNDSQIKYSAHIDEETRSLEARVLLDEIEDEKRKLKVKQVMEALAGEKKLKYHNRTEFAGIGFEVRYCYQIGDSKRIQADLHMADHLFSDNILPVMLIFCSTSLEDPVDRFRKRSYWTVLEGRATYSLLEALTGFDFYSFLKEDPEARGAIESIMGRLLAKFES